MSLAGGSDESASYASSNMEVPDIPSSSSTKDMKSFSQVVFPEISDYFPPGKDVQVTYVLTEALEPSSRDWIGLFQVGWTSAREYMTFVWAPKLKSSNPEDRTVTATFTAYYLPKDNNEFYQFCYVTRQGHVRGASTPFQFRQPSECDQLVEVEDENGMILLKTKSAYMEEQIGHLKQEKGKLEEQVKELENTIVTQKNDLSNSASEIESVRQEKHLKEQECQKLEKEIADLSAKLEEISGKLKTAEETVNAQKGELEGSTSQIAQLKDESSALAEELKKVKADSETHISSLNEQLDDKVGKLTELESLVHDLTENLEQKKAQETNQQSEVAKARDEAKAKAVRYEEEKDLYKKQLAHSEEERRVIMQQLASMKEQINVTQTEVTEKVGKIAAYEEKTKMLKSALKEAEKQSAVQKSVIDSQLSNIEDKLNACEASKRLISDELTEARDHRDKLMSELHQAKKEKDQMTHDLEAARRQLGELEKIYMEMMDQAARSDQRCAEKEKKLIEEKAFAKEREKALQENIAVLKSQLESADMAVAAAASSSDDRDRSENGTQTPVKEQDSTDTNAKDKDNIISDLKVQIEDLRTRLSMGAAAYTEKYKECHKLERKMKKMQNVKTAAQAVEEESTTTDSQDDSAKKDVKAVKSKTQMQESVKEEEQPHGGNFMSRLEQLFMAIADPDVEEQEKAKRLKSRMEELEKNVQFQHDKYKKYKQRYYDEKQFRASDHEKLATEILSLTCEVDELKNERDNLKHENEALKEQLNEFVVNSKDENIVKTRMPGDIIIPTVTGVTSISRSSYPHEIAPSTYPHHQFEGNDLDASRDSSSESDLSGEFQLANSGFSALGFCPKNQITSDESDPTAISRPYDFAAPESGVIKRQPTRSPPMIEVISDDSNDFSSPQGASGGVGTTSAPAKQEPRPRRRRNDKKTLRNDFA